MILTFPILFPFNSFFVLVNLIICNGVEWILGVRRFVHGRIVLIAALDDALGCGTHQYDVFTDVGGVGVLHLGGFVPGNALEDVRLRSS